MLFKAICVGLVVLVGLAAMAVVVPLALGVWIVSKNNDEDVYSHG